MTIRFPRKHRTLLRLVAGEALERRSFLSVSPMIDLVTVDFPPTGEAWIQSQVQPAATRIDGLRARPTPVVVDSHAFQAGIDDAIEPDVPPPVLTIDIGNSLLTTMDESFQSQTFDRPPTSQIQEGSTASRPGSIPGSTPPWNVVIAGYAQGWEHFTDQLSNASPLPVSGPSIPRLNSETASNRASVDLTEGTQDRLDYGISDPSPSSDGDDPDSFILDSTSLGNDASAPAFGWTQNRLVDAPREGVRPQDGSSSTLITSQATARLDGSLPQAARHSAESMTVDIAISLRQVATGAPSNTIETTLGAALEFQDVAWRNPQGRPTTAYVATDMPHQGRLRLVEEASDINMSFAASSRGMEVFVGYRGIPVVSVEAAGTANHGDTPRIEVVPGTDQRSPSAGYHPRRTSQTMEFAAESVAADEGWIAGMHRVWQRMAGGWSRYLEGVLSTAVAAGTVWLYQRQITQGDREQAAESYWRRWYTAAFMERNRTSPAPKINEQ